MKIQQFQLSACVFFLVAISCWLSYMLRREHRRDVVPYVGFWATVLSPFAYFYPTPSDGNTFYLWVFIAVIGTIAAVWSLVMMWIVSRSESR